MPEVQVGNLKFKEAIKFIQDKLLIPSKQWTDTIGPIHAKAFTVAGATKLSIVQDLYQAVQNSILDGTTLTEFRKQFDQIVDKHGWSYKGKRGWRTSVIFRMNKRSAQMAGRWEQFNRVKQVRPFLQYQTVGDERVRESHAAWHGRIYPVDHPFWKTHFPPNGWLCRCTVRSLSQDDMEEDELSVSKEPIPKSREFVDGDSGELYKKYPGIDRGFDFNVGKSWLAPDSLLGQQLMELPSKLRADAIKWFDNDIYDKPFEKLTKSVASLIVQGKKKFTASKSQTVGIMSEKVISALEKKGKVPVGLTAIARDSDIAHWLRDEKVSRAASVSMSLAASLPKIFRAPDAVIYDNVDTSLIYAKRLDDGRYVKFVLKLYFKAKLNVNKSRFRGASNTFQSAGVVAWSSLNGERFEIIEGKIER